LSASTFCSCFLDSKCFLSLSRLIPYSGPWRSQTEHRICFLSSDSTKPARIVRCHVYFPAYFDRTYRHLRPSGLAALQEQGLSKWKEDEVNQRHSIDQRYPCLKWKVKTSKRTRIVQRYITWQDRCWSANRSNLIFGLNFFLFELLANLSSQNLSEFCFQPRPQLKFVRTLLLTSFPPETAKKWLENLQKKLVCSPGTSMRQYLLYWSVSVGHCPKQGRVQVRSDAEVDQTPCFVW
jgi:hypothetical protein